MSFNNYNGIAVAVIDANNSETSNKSVEVIRRCSNEDTVNFSFDTSCYVSITENEKLIDTPPFVSMMMIDEPSNYGNSLDNSTQTEPFVSLPLNCSPVDFSFSFNKDFNVQNCSSNDNSEQSSGSKRYRQNSVDSETNDRRPHKKTKCTDSSSSSTSDFRKSKDSLDELHINHQLSSNSDTSFKSIKSNTTFKVRKRRLKSESSLFKDVLQKSRKLNTPPHGYYYSDNSSPGKF